MMLVSMYVLAFVAGSGLVFGVNLLYADIQRERRKKMLEQFAAEQRLLQRDRAETAVANQHLYELSADPNDLMSRRSWREKLALFFEQSGVQVTPIQVALLAAAGTIVAASIGWLTTRHLAFTLFLGLLGGAIPVIYVVTVRNRRLRRLQHQLPDAFDVISRMMQAGRTFPQAMQTAAQDASQPLSQEFGYCCDQQQLGMPQDAALKDLARRNGLLEIKIFVLAVSIHRQTGGNLSSLLEKLADVIRGRVRMNDMISALTSEARMQVYVLTVLPIIALIVMTVVRPVYAKELYDRPALLMYCIGSLIIGWIWMRRILNFSF